MRSIFTLSRRLSRRALIYKQAHRQRINVIEPISEFATNQSRCYSVTPSYDNIDGHNFERPHKIPRRLSMYMSLNDDIKRKIVDPAYIKEAVQDTFMQRANGDYSYRGSKRVAKNNAHIHSKKREKSSFVMAKDMVQIKVKRQASEKNREVRQSALSVDLQENSLMQLESVRKKLCDSGPNVLDYMMSKHKPITSEKQLKARKQKYSADTKESAPALKRVFSLGRNDDLNITPRCIELRAQARKANELQRTKKKQPLLKTYKPSNLDIGKIDEMKHRKARAHVEADRQAILSRIKSVVAPPKNSVEVQRHTHSSCFELTPQIYPKGSLSIKKSYLPIEPCRRRVSTESKKSEGFPNQKKAEETPRSKNIVQKVRGSLTSFFSSLVPSNFK